MIPPNGVGVYWFAGGGGGGGGGGRSGESAHKFSKTNETLFSFGQQLCLCKLTELDNHVTDMKLTYIYAGMVKIP